jgi:hypothetical protein
MDSLLTLLLAQSALCACIALALMLRDVGREIASQEAGERHKSLLEDDRKRKNRLREIFYNGWNSARMDAPVTGPA